MFSTSILTEVVSYKGEEMLYSFFKLFLPVILLLSSNTNAEPFIEFASAYCLLKKLINAHCSVDSLLL